MGKANKLLEGFINSIPAEKLINTPFPAPYIRTQASALIFRTSVPLLKTTCYSVLA